MNSNSLHYVYIKKHFCRYYLQCFSSERTLIEHREVFLKVNGKQSVKLKHVLLNIADS